MTIRRAVANPVTDDALHAEAVSRGLAMHV
jgi:hypothetical protein